jgi:CheY-like chemotaxis protein
MLLEIILQNLGHDIVACENGAEAVKAASSRRFDLIILDLQMPIMGGIQAAKIIRTLNESVGSKNIIALTASSIPETQKEATDAGIDLIITKPFNEDELEAILKNI